MDVTLVLTHRCNLACRYCYAGEHHRADMSDAVMERALDLLYMDGAAVAQLGFFGGEPLLAFDRLVRALAGARARAAAAPGRELVVQLTTNGTRLGPRELAVLQAERARVTVSLDGVREAHDLGRPLAGGGSSFEQARAGLMALTDAGLEPDVMMVVRPETALFLFRSVEWLWGEGVRRVRMNLAPGGWTAEARQDLEDELTAVGRSLLARRLRGERVVFEPFDAVMRVQPGAAAAAACAPPRPRVVVGVTGHLYPCAPMVGEDRDAGPEAAQRIGHLDDGPAKIAAAVAAEGVACGSGGACKCAAYLETGDRNRRGPEGAWFYGVCTRLGIALAAAIEDAVKAAGAPPPDLPRARTTSRDRAVDRRRALALLATLGAGAAVAGSGLVAISRLRGKPANLTAGEMIARPAPPPVETVKGEMAAPPPNPPQPPPPGGLAPPPPPVVEGGIGPPPEQPPPKSHTEHAEKHAPTPADPPPDATKVDGDMAF
jgi:uncharacterized protein